MVPLISADALIFDIDGTLWNATASSAKGWNCGLARLGIDRTITAKEIETVSGRPFEDCVDLLLPGLRMAYPSLLETLNDSETAVVRAEGGEFFEGAREGLIRLASEYRIFLASNCQEWYLNVFIEQARLGDVLAGTDCFGRSGASKREMLSRLKDRYALTNPVYIGDTAGDESAARAADMIFVHAAWGFGTPQQQSLAMRSFDEVVRHFVRAA